MFLALQIVYEEEIPKQLFSNSNKIYDLENAPTYIFTAVILVATFPTLLICSGLLYPSWLSFGLNSILLETRIAVPTFSAFLLDMLISFLQFVALGCLCRWASLKVTDIVWCFSIQSTTLHLYSGELGPSAFKVSIERGYYL